VRPVPSSQSAPPKSSALAFDSTSQWRWGALSPVQAIPLFDLDICKTLANYPGVKHVVFIQHIYGAASSKPTRILYWGIDLAALVDEGERACQAENLCYTKWNRRRASCWGEQHPSPTPQPTAEPLHPVPQLTPPNSTNN
jgi:hypothetical protein